MFYNVLDKKRLDILPLFKNFKKDFYLAGGTALAFQIGHRDSVDFDFFSQNDIDTVKVFEWIKDVFIGHEILKIQEEKNTLSLLVDENIKLSFFTYKYGTVNDLVDEENFNLASFEDIGCMKLSAITGRASNKDYIDLYYILQKMKLCDLLEKASIKFPDVDKNLILKSLVFFEDIKKEPIRFRNGNHVEFKEVERFLQKEVKKIAKG